MTRMIEVVGSKNKSERASRCLPTTGEFSSEKVEARRGRKKEESGSETVFDCVAFSLSRLFRNEYRQWSTQRRFFFRYLKEEEFPSLLPLHFFRSSGYISLSWLNVTETRLQSVNITSSVPVFLFSYFETEFRCCLALIPNRKIPWTDEAETRFKLN